MNGCDWAEKYADSGVSPPSMCGSGVTSRTGGGGGLFTASWVSVVVGGSDWISVGEEASGIAKRGANEVCPASVEGPTSCLLAVACVMPRFIGAMKASIDPNDRPPGVNSKSAIGFQLVVKADGLSS